MGKGRAQPSRIAYRIEPENFSRLHTLAKEEKRTLTTILNNALSLYFDLRYSLDPVAWQRFIGHCGWRAAPPGVHLADMVTELVEFDAGQKNGAPSYSPGAPTSR